MCQQTAARDYDVESAGVEIRHRIASLHARDRCSCMVTLDTPRYVRASHAVRPLHPRSEATQRLDLLRDVHSRLAHHFHSPWFDRRASSNPCKVASAHSTRKRAVHARARRNYLRSPRRWSDLHVEPGANPRPSETGTNCGCKGTSRCRHTADRTPSTRTEYP